MLEDLQKIPSKANLEQFDVSVFAKDKIRELFRGGKLPTAEIMIEEILLRAIKQGATDIHIEPAQALLAVRLGFEGVLKRLVALPKEISENLVNVIKTKANLNAFEKKKPQEGRFSLVIGAHTFDIRINTIPCWHGERVAIRIFHRTGKISGLAEIGFSEENLNIMRHLLRRPAGLILIVGPTGCGKSTTTYAIINEMNTPERNIMTVEDPIEYKLEFAAQIQPTADKSFTMADALRSILRQNPNIIMVSEIRDGETIGVTAEAALTGHLVVSSMLSGDAIGTIPRLFNLGISPYWLASTLMGVVYQQLVRKICSGCKEEHQPAPEELESLGDMNTGWAKFYRGKGCPQCDNTGYDGRTAIHEIFTIDEQIRDLLYQQASTVKMREAAGTAGFKNVRVDAFNKVNAGITTLSEFVRVLG